MDKNTATFKLSPVFYKKLGRAYLFKSLPLTALALGVGVLVGARAAGYATLLGLAPILLAILGFSLAFSYRSQRKSWSTFTIYVDQDSVKKTRAGYSDVEIKRDDVTAIQEIPGQGLVIRTSDNLHFIGIPDSLEGYAACRARLSAWRSIETVVVRPGMNNMVVWVGLAAMAGLYVVMSSESDILVIPIGTALVAFLIWSLFLMRKSNLVPRSAKRFSWLMIFPILSILVRVIAALFD